MTMKIVHFERFVSDVNRDLGSKADEIKLVNQELVIHKERIGELQRHVEVLEGTTALESKQLARFQ